MQAGRSRIPSTHLPKHCHCPYVTYLNYLPCHWIAACTYLSASFLFNYLMLDQGLECTVSDSPVKHHAKL